MLSVAVQHAIGGTALGAPWLLPKFWRWRSRSAPAACQCAEHGAHGAKHCALQWAQAVSWRKKKAAPAVRPQRRRGAPVEVSGATRVVSTATWPPFQRARPLAMTSILRSSGLPGSTFKSRKRTRCWTEAPALQQTRAAARSRGPPRERSTPKRGHAATWSPRTSKPRRHRQAAGARGSGIRNRRRSSALKRGDGRQSSGEVGRCKDARCIWASQAALLLAVWARSTRARTTLRVSATPRARRGWSICRPTLVSPPPRTPVLAAALAPVPRAAGTSACLG